MKFILGAIAIILALCFVGFLLPAIASEMERKGCFRLTEEEIVSVVEPILKGRDANGNMPVTDKAYPCSVIGEYGKQCLSGYKGSDSLPIVIAKGKKLYDKREDAAIRSANRDIDRAVKSRNS